VLECCSYASTDRANKAGKISDGGNGSKPAKDPLAGLTGEARILAAQALKELQKGKSNA
jgi:hypothetical protein